MIRRVRDGPHPARWLAPPHLTLGVSPRVGSRPADDIVTQSEDPVGHYRGTLRYRAAPRIMWRPAGWGGRIQ